MGSSKWNWSRERHATRRPARTDFRKLDRRFILEDLEPRWLLAITATGIPAVFTEGDGATSSLLATFTDSTPSAASAYAVTINWGDGGPTSAGTVSLAGTTYFITASHSYAEQTPGISPNQVSISIVETGNGNDTKSVATTAAVADAALNPIPVTFSPSETVGFNGTVASFTDNDPNGTASDYVTSIDWGDGTTTAGSVSGSGTFHVGGTHTYAEDGSYSVKVTVIDNSVPGAPSSLVAVNSTAQVQEASFILATGGPVTGTEGTAITGATLATFSDPLSPDTASDFTATVTWGDGTTDTGTVSGAAGSFTVTDSHTYHDEGTFGYLVTVSENDANFSIGPVGFSATIAEGDSLSGTATSISATEGASFSGAVATFSNTLTTTPSSDFTATINWGDGTTTSGSVSGSGGAFTVSGSHTYADEQSGLPVIVTLTDDAPGTATASVTSTANVGEGDSLTATAATFSATENVPFIRPVATFSDTLTTTPASDFTATVDWGDGTVTAGIVSGTNGQFTVQGIHMYAEDGTYSPVVTISDDAPGTATASVTSTANVGEASFSVTSAGNISATEGTLTSPTLATFQDPGSPDPASDFTATIVWGDGVTDTGTVTGSAGSYSVSGSHSYADEGSFTYAVTVSEPTANFTIGPVSGAVTVSEGDSLSGFSLTIGTTEGTGFNGAVATFSDTLTTNPASDFTATINWGDGTVTPGSVTGTGGAFTVSGAHTYADEQSGLPVIVTLTDDAPGSATASVTSTANVGEADSLTGASITFGVTEGSVFSGTVATFGDTLTTNPSSDFTATIDWGDGTVTAGTVSGTNGQFAVAGSHAYAQDGTYSPIVTLSDDAPGTATASVTSTANVSEDASTFSTTGLSFSPTEGTVFNGAVANFSDPGTDLAGAFAATINWGDGLTTTGTVTGSNGSYSVGGSHTYADEATYNVSIVISEPGVNFSTTAIGSAQIGEGDSLSANPVTTSATEGIAFSGTIASFLDTGYPANTSSDFSATIDWGDGTTTSGSITGTFVPATSLTPAALQLSVSGTHVYWGDGKYSPVVTLSDDSPSKLGASVNSEIDVAEPVNEISVSGVSLTGVALLPLSNVTVATFTDVNAKNESGNPAHPSDYLAQIDWGDGTTTAGAISTAGGGYRVAGTHTYHTAGQYSLNINVEEASEPSNVYSATSSANIIAGSITASPVNFNPTEGTPYRGPVATFTDNVPGPAASDFIANIDWGDGTMTSGTITGPVNGVFTVSGPHTYADEATHFAKVSILSEVAGKANVSDFVQVQEGDVLTPIGATIHGTAKVAFNGPVATFSDTYLGNTSGDFVATIAWGDGAVTQGFVTGGNGTLTVSGSHTYSQSKTFQVKVVLKEDPNGTATATALSSAVIAPMITAAVPHHATVSPAAVVGHPSSSNPLAVHDLVLSQFRIKHRRRHH